MWEENLIGPILFENFKKPILFEDWKYSELEVYSVNFKNEFEFTLFYEWWIMILWITLSIYIMNNLNVQHFALKLKAWALSQSTFLRFSHSLLLQCIRDFNDKNKDNMGWESDWSHVKALAISHSLSLSLSLDTRRVDPPTLAWIGIIRQLFSNHNMHENLWICTL